MDVRVEVEELDENPAETLGRLVEDEYRKVLARKQILQRRIRLAKPELETVSERLDALKVISGDKRDRFGVDAYVRRTDSTLKRWEPTYGGSAWSGVTSGYLNGKIHSLFGEPTVAELEENSEKIADLLEFFHHVEVPAFWYWLRVKYNDDVNKMLEENATVFGIRKKVRV